MYRRPGEFFMCPKTSEPCMRSFECEPANEPLEQAIRHIRQSLTNSVSADSIRDVLRHSLQVQAKVHDIDFHTSFSDDSARICPADFLAMQGERYGDEYARSTIRSIAARCVATTIVEINKRTPSVE